MGKPTGFLEYDREVSKAVKPHERIKNFNEFHTPLSRDHQQEQAARCMECGVPFCQSGMTLMGMTSGCPLHNLVPEWNDLVYTGNWKQAYNRLKRPIISRNLPEECARHCARQHAPAVCTEIRSAPRKMSYRLLNMRIRTAMQIRSRQEPEPEKRLQSSAPVQVDLQPQTS